MDLIETAIAATHEPDLRPVDPSRAGPFAAALAIKSLKLYEVLTDSMARAGYGEGDTVIVDVSVTDWAHVPAASAVAVMIEADGRSFLCLRHYVPPSMLLTNADDGNSLLDFRTAPVRVTLSGVVLQRVTKNGENHRNGSA